MKTGGDIRNEWDFFISYTQADKAWAEWIAWVLEEDGHKILIQAWDFVPGSNWVQGMQAGTRDATRTIAVMSNAYLKSVYCDDEWQAAYNSDPGGLYRKLLVVRVAPCKPDGLLAQKVWVDIFGVTEASAQALLREMVEGAATGRRKPRVAPAFPGADRAMPYEPDFPGVSTDSYATGVGGGSKAEIGTQDEKTPTPADTPTELQKTLDPRIDKESTKEALQSRESKPSRPGRWAWASGALVVVLAVGALLVLLLAPGSPHVSKSSASVSFTLQQDHNRLLVTRHWTLSGRGGSVFTEMANVNNVTSKALRVSFEEPIPPVTAASPPSPRFSPSPSKVLNTPHVVTWRLRVPAHRARVVRYQIPVASEGATMSRLELWMTNFKKQMASLLPVKLKSLSISLRTKSIARGKTVLLTLTGLLSDGKKASQADLSSAVWHSDNVHRATVGPPGSVGKITGKQAGKVRITAHVGKTYASVSLTVYNSTVTTPSLTSPNVPPFTPRPTPTPTQTRQPGPTGSPSPLPT